MSLPVNFQTTLIPYSRILFRPGPSKPELVGTLTYIGKYGITIQTDDGKNYPLSTTVFATTFLAVESYPKHPKTGETLTTIEQVRDCYPEYFL